MYIIISSFLLGCSFLSIQIILQAYIFLQHLYEIVKILPKIGFRPAVRNFLMEAYKKRMRFANGSQSFVWFIRHLLNSRNSRNCSFEIPEFIASFTSFIQ